MHDHIQKPSAFKTRVLVVSQGERLGDSLFTVTPRFEVDRKSQLRGVDLTQYDAIIIHSERTLKTSPKNRLLVNVEVPIIYCSEKDFDDYKTRKTIRDYNLYGITDLESIDRCVDDALTARSSITHFLECRRDGLKLLRRRESPRFKNALKLAEEFNGSSALVFSEKIVSRAYQILVDKMLLHFLADDEQKKKRVGETLAVLISEFIDMKLTLTQQEMLNYLGDGFSGEDDVNTLSSLAKSGETFQYVIPFELDTAKHLAFTGLRDRKWVYRVIEDARDLSAKVNANQRYNTVKFFNENEQNYNVRRILPPLHLSDYKKNRTESFVLLQYEPGRSLDHVLELLNSEYKGSDRKTKKQIDLLRTYFVETTIESQKIWVRADLPMPKNKKSKGKLKRTYEKNLRTLPQSLDHVSTASFNESEQEIWKQALKVFRIMHPAHPSKDNIVKHRDLDFGNIIVGPYDNWSVTKLLKTFIDRHGNVDEEKVKRYLTQIDIKGGWRHCLEDPAHVYASYESRFLLEDESTAKQKLLEYRDNYVKGIDKIHLKKDDNSWLAMLLYRSSRKIDLHFMYWLKNTEKHANQTISGQTLLEQKKNIFQITLFII